MLINCVAYQQGKKLADIEVAAISDYLQHPDCFVWVALKDASDEELFEMQREFGLHELAVEDARHGHQRPKIEEYGDTVFAVMHMIEFAPTDELQRGRGLRLRRQQLRALGAQPLDAWASWACANAPSANRTCCATARPSSSMP